MDYEYIHENSYIRKIKISINNYHISKSFYKRIDYLNKKLYWITDRNIKIFLNEGLEDN